MADHPSRHDAHLLVAAIRVLEHVEQHPPTEQEIAVLLRWHVDRVRVVAHGLDSLGAVAAIKSPFDVRYKVGDHSLVDTLDDEGVDDSISREIHEFEQRSKSDQEKIERMFGTMPSRERPEEATRGLDAEFGEFSRRKPRDPFGGG